MSELFVFRTSVEGAAIATYAESSCL